MVIVDSNIVFDLWDQDPVWGSWSAQQLRSLSTAHDLAINAVIYAEISARFSSQANLDKAVDELGLIMLEIPRDAAFLAGNAFQQYRQQGGNRTNVLPDFFIGAHAASLRCEILTRDTRPYSTYFPAVPLISP
ncbi:MAG: type II toxin-antitoxin system VapC family toxin [Terracidiphilus sp.]|jgi:predicted nucleic acid-binding protein